MRRAFEASFARMLVLVLPATLALTYLWKQVEITNFRAAATRELAPAASREVRLSRVSAPMQPQAEPRHTRAAPVCSASERSTLQSIGLALGLDAGWGANGDCCEWRGVGCTGAGAVESLSFAKLGLTGTVPPELGALSRLRTLDLNENPRLRGVLPAQLFEPVSRPLTHVYSFGNAALSGTLPRSVPKLLQEFEASRCRLSGTLPAYEYAGALRYVFLERNAISGTIPRSFGSLRRLRELELSGNRLSGSVPSALLQIPMAHFDVANNAPTLKGAPVKRPKQGCSGGGDKYLRGDGAMTSDASAAPPTTRVAASASAGTGSAGSAAPPPPALRAGLVEERSRRGGRLGVGGA